MVHLPTGTNGVDTSAHRTSALLGNLTSARLGGWRPHHQRRLAIPLQLPLRDDPTTIITVHGNGI